LHIATIEARFEVLTLLLRCPGINVNIRDNRGRTPLHYAAERNDITVATALLSVDSIKVSLRDLGRVLFVLRRHPLNTQRPTNW
jgi:ankyrin repeat protein